jgi:hypothetical protein
METTVDVLGFCTTTEPTVQQRMYLYLYNHIGVASTLTNGFSMRCDFGRC